jgi:hypothetical protein
VSSEVDSDLPSELRAQLLDEIRAYLPAFLHRGASEQRDPVGDVKELLNLDGRDLRRVVAVHSCLDEAVLALGDGLREGIRNPVASSIRPPEAVQAVRGAVDWMATIARRSQEAGNESRYVVRSARRVFDLPENRALVWLLDRLRSATQAALRESVDRAAVSSPGSDAAGWADRIRRLSAQVEVARRAEWLRGVQPELPEAKTIRRLRAARSSFYADAVAGAVRAMLALEDPSDQVLADVLCRRYFEPAPTWLIFEVCVALRLSRAFGEASGKPRKARLLVGGDRAPFARYAYPDGSEVSLIYQAWPSSPGRSLLRETGERHGINTSSSRPDIFVVRSGPNPDAAILELKATHKAGSLKRGLSELLCYLADRPEVWAGKPAGWLVAPSSAAFADRAPDERHDLWVVSADRVAAAAVSRFAPAEAAAEPG